MATTANNTALIQEKLSERAILNLSGNESLLRTFEDYSGMLSGDGNTVKIPKMNAGANIQVKAEDGSYVMQTVDTAPVVINVDKRAGDAFYITDELSQAEKVNYLNLRSEQVVDKLKDYVNGDGHSVLTANVTATIGDGTTDITAAFITEAAEALDEAGAPKSDRFLLVSNKQFYKLKFLPEFNTKEWNNNGDSSTMTVGDVLGFTVIPQATSIIGTNNIAYHKSALGFASNKKVGIESQRNLLGKRNDFAVDMVYGLESINPEYSLAISCNA